MQIHRRKSVEIQRKSCVSERQYDNDWADGFKSRIKYTLVRAYTAIQTRVYACICLPQTVEEKNVVVFLLLMLLLLLR